MEDEGKLLNFFKRSAIDRNLEWKFSHGSIVMFTNTGMVLIS